MAKGWDAAKVRLHTKGADGNLLSAIQGNENDADLRELVIEFSRGCPTKMQHAHCPFCLLGGLPPDTLKNLVKTMSRQTMLYLFETEHRLRNQMPRQNPDSGSLGTAENQPRA